MRWRWAGVTLAALAAVGILYGVFRSGSASPGSARSGGPAYAVGSPGPGAMAPNVDLASTTGGRFDLAAQRGKTVLLFFQEGIDCEPCWTQLKAIQAHLARFRAAGIDEVVSVTTDPLYALRQKAVDENLHLPMLSDPTLSVSRAYHANQYGMMGTSADGHSFVVVDSTGRIRWRADYGGAPNYTMYVPVPDLLRQMGAGMAQAPVSR